MKRYIFVVLLAGILVTLAVAFSMAKYKEPIPVYIEKPPLTRTVKKMSTPEKNRLYAKENPIPVMSKEAKKHYDSIKKEERENGRQ